MCAAGVHVALTDHAEVDRLTGINRSSAIDQCARILPVTDPDSHRGGIEAHVFNTLILDMPEEDYRVIGGKPVYFLDCRHDVAIITNIGYLPLFVALVEFGRSPL